MKGLYIHIPFCKTICSYCDFIKQMPYKNIEEVYINNLLKELDSYKDKLSNITSVYIGGGTPNSLKLDLLETLLSALKPYLDKSIENTIELNPELVTTNLAILLNKYNINRVSLGVQSINTKHIKLLNRHHTKEIVINAYNILAKYIKNINLDLMYGIPYQTLEDIKEDLELVKTLNPTHISYYSLILEDKTVLSYKLFNNEISLLDDDIVADMNDYVNKYLKDLGYTHYETSNYALKGYESKHNLLYWSMSDYVGIGAGACGFIDNIRYQNNHILKKYFLNYIESKENITLEEKRSEFMFLGLRKLEGINILEYNNMFGSNPIDDYHLEDLLKNKSLILENNYLRISEDKIFVSNQILIRFVGEE